MTWNGRRPRQTGKLTVGMLAALLAAATLAGCGGGGGGGGGGSSSGGSGGGGGGGNSVPEVLVVSQAVTPAGGTVGTVAANGIQVGIPAGTDLNTNVTSYTIGIYTLPAADQPTLPVGQALAGSVFDVRATATSGQPDGGTFTPSVTLAIQYPSTLTPSQLALAEIMYYDPTSSSWQTLAPGTQSINTTTGTISAQTTKLTYYALFYPTLPGNPMARPKP